MSLPSLHLNLAPSAQMKQAEKKVDDHDYEKFSLKTSKMMRMIMMNNDDVGDDDDNDEEVVAQSCCISSIQNLPEVNVKLEELSSQVS